MLYKIEYCNSYCPAHKCNANPQINLVRLNIAVPHQLNLDSVEKKTG